MEFQWENSFHYLVLKKSKLILCGLTFYHTDANVTPVSIASNKDVALGQKFTTSNFTESIVVSSDPVFGSNGNSKSSANQPVVKKRKLESNKTNITDDMIRYCKAKESHTAVTVLIFWHLTHKKKWRRKRIWLTLKMSLLTHTQRMREYVCMRLCTMYFELIVNTIPYVLFISFFLSLLSRTRLFHSNRIASVATIHTTCVVWLWFFINTRATSSREGIKDVSVTLVPLSYEKGEISINETKKVSKNNNKRIS